MPPRSCPMLPCAGPAAAAFRTPVGSAAGAVAPRSTSRRDAGRPDDFGCRIGRIGEIAMTC